MSIRSVAAWEASKWWPIAEKEAHDRWLKNVASGARSGLIASFRDPKEYAASARWASDRLFRELAPPTQKHDLGAPGIESFEIRLVKAAEPKS